MKTIKLTNNATLSAQGITGEKNQYEDNLLKHSPGKKHYAMKVDDDIREYYVHVPPLYDGSTAFPAVIMLHGSGGDGLKFYNNSGWKEVGNNEDVLTIFPSSFKYDCVFDDGVQKYNAEKWNSYDLVVCDNNKKRNDVKFLSNVIDDLKQKFFVDETRIYMVGFSNGGEMAARCAIELSHKLTAVVSCAGALPPNFNTPVQRLLPVLLQIGSADQHLIANLGIQGPLQMNIPSILAAYPDMQNVINSYINCFALQPVPSPESGDAAKYLEVTYQGISGDPNNIFSFFEVAGLHHRYPDGKHHTFNSAEAHWSWLKNFAL